MGDDLAAEGAVLGGDVALDLGEARDPARVAVRQEQRGQAADRVADDVEPVDLPGLEDLLGDGDQKGDGDGAEVRAGATSVPARPRAARTAGRRWVSSWTGRAPRPSRTVPWRRSPSSATCCGRCSTRSTTPTGRNGRGRSRRYRVAACPGALGRAPPRPGSAGGPAGAVAQGPSVELHVGQLDPPGTPGHPEVHDGVERRRPAPWSGSGTVPRPSTATAAPSG